MLNQELGSNITVVCIAPHPDDEVVGCGGLIAGLTSIGAKVQVIHLTDGTSENFVLWPSVRGILLPPIFFLRPELSRILRMETTIRSWFSWIRFHMAINAASCLGLEASNVMFLGFRDGHLKDNLREASHKVGLILATARPDALLFTHSNDLHPDHIAANLIVVQALSALQYSPYVLNYGVYVRQEKSIPIDVSRFQVARIRALKAYLPMSYVTRSFARVSRFCHEYLTPVDERSGEFLQNILTAIQANT